jgi:CO/xanthine dehydrogenase Mo-binding subunit
MIVEAVRAAARTSAAIANAIEDAVGVRVTQIPFSPERVLAAIEAAR